MSAINFDDVENISVDERRQKTLEIIEKKGKVRVNELSSMFSISEVTIRNDLSELERAGLLERVHGGAISTNKAYFNMNFTERITKYENEKREIAIAAAKLIEPGDTITINSGTTTYFIAQALKNLASLTVVTNSIVIAQELAPNNRFNIILLGGNYNPRYQFTYGENAVQQLLKYKTDKLILSADGVSFEHGLTTHHHQEAEISRTMIDRVGQTIVVADFSKIGRENFAQIAPVSAIDVLITNQSADVDELNRMRESGINVITV